MKKIEEYTNNTRQVLSASTSKVNIFTGTFTTTTANSKFGYKHLFLLGELKQVQLIWVFRGMEQIMMVE